MDYLALFSTTTAAVKFHKKLGKLGLPVEALPVPRQLSSSCGIAVSFVWDGDPLPLADESVFKMYAVQINNYHLIYAKA